MVGFRPEETEEILGLVSQGRVGGIILFERNAHFALDVADLCLRLREAVSGNHPQWAVPLMAVDQEQGRVRRIVEGVTSFPGAALLGKISRPQTTRRVACWVARELSALGIHLNLAPVADVPGPGGIPSVLEGRVFGSDPSAVARHVAAWVKGSQEGGVAACVKHFPGHGCGMEDSHCLLPVDASGEEMIRRVHLRPFRYAFGASVAAFMVGHVAYDAIHAGIPASLSHKVWRVLLRSGIGFSGLGLTDDLEMDAVAKDRDPVDAVLSALAAGADMALVGRNLRGTMGLEELVREVERAWRRGILPSRRGEEALRRVLTFKRRWIPPQWAPPSRRPPLPEAQAFAHRLWKEVEGVWEG